MTYLLFATAFTLSSIAAYYSIVGLVAIFAGAPISIAIMGSALEVAKIVTVSWLQKNWTTAPRVLKLYFSVAVAILMLITSLGIFGYLSRAHMDQTLVSGDFLSKIAVYDEKIKTARENIEADRKQLKQMDEAVDQVMARSTTEEGAAKSNAIRKAQVRDRSALAKSIEANQKLIASLNDEVAPLRAEIRKVEVEVGPIKYIASFVYGETSTELLERAVTWIIIVIIFVFDPLAVLLFIAFNRSYKKDNQEISRLDPIVNSSEIHYTNEFESSKSNMHEDKNIISVFSLEDRIKVEKNVI
jgi:Skp family chaperone for outer membrane proteins